MSVTELKRKEYLKCPFNMRISRNMKEQLQDLSDEYGLSTSYIVRKAVSDWLNENTEDE
jgi:predicted DNA-binding protein